jgi:hypothetical protein
MKSMENNRSTVRPYLLFMGIAVSACSQKVDPSILEKVQNRESIDQSVKQWSQTTNRAEKRAETLNLLLGCTRDSAKNLETRAYCLQALNSLSGKSDQALEEINGLILPKGVSKLAKAFEELETTQTQSR